MSYCVGSHSGAMGCHGDLLFLTSNIFKGILFLCSLWRGGVTLDTLGLAAWLCWIGLKVLVLMQGWFESLEFLGLFGFCLFFFNLLTGFQLSLFFVRIQNWAVDTQVVMEVQNGQTQTPHSITAVPLALHGLPTADSAARLHLNFLLKNKCVPSPCLQTRTWVILSEVFRKRGGKFWRRSWPKWCRIRTMKWLVIGHLYPARPQRCLHCP